MRLCDGTTGMTPTGSKASGRRTHASMRLPGRLTTRRRRALPTKPVPPVTRIYLPKLNASAQMQPSMQKNLRHKARARNLKRRTPTMGAAISQLGHSFQLNRAGLITKGIPRRCPDTEWTGNRSQQYVLLTTTSPRDHNDPRIERYRPRPSKPQIAPQ